MLARQGVKHSVECFELFRRCKPTLCQQPQCGRERLQHQGFAERTKTEAALNAFCSLHRQKTFTDLLWSAHEQSTPRPIDTADQSSG